MTKERFEAAREILKKIDILKTGISIMEDKLPYSFLKPTINIYIDDIKIEAANSILQKLIKDLLDAYKSKLVEMEQKFAAL